MAARARFAGAGRRTRWLAAALTCALFVWASVEAARSGPQQLRRMVAGGRPKPTMKCGHSAFGGGGARFRRRAGELGRRGAFALLSASANANQSNDGRAREWQLVSARRPTGGVTSERPHCRGRRWLSLDLWTARNTSGRHTSASSWPRGPKADSSRRRAQLAHYIRARGQRKWEPAPLAQRPLADTVTSRAQTKTRLRQEAEVGELAQFAGMRLEASSWPAARSMVCGGPSAH